jgi:hypothetical protein
LLFPPTLKIHGYSNSIVGFADVSAAHRFVQWTLAFNSGEQPVEVTNLAKFELGIKPIPHSASSAIICTGLALRSRWGIRRIFVARHMVCGS